MRIRPISAVICALKSDANSMLSKERLAFDTCTLVYLGRQQLAGCTPLIYLVAFTYADKVAVYAQDLVSSFIILIYCHSTLR